MSAKPHVDRQGILRKAFKMDVQALKPGNVGLHGAGHGMRPADFRLSAEVATPILCDAKLSCGARVLAAVAATRQAVGCNTNLGMLLLAAPMICAMERWPGNGGLGPLLELVLGALDMEDSRGFFQAIALASPGGLGKAQAHDVRAEPDCGILEAMRSASMRDGIARQYANGFQEVFAGSQALSVGLRKWGRLSWAVTGWYLSLLANAADSHVIRKHGLKAALAHSRECRVLAGKFERIGASHQMRTELLAKDREWKERGINPGTSADLAFCSVLVHLWEQGVREESPVP